MLSQHGMLYSISMTMTPEERAASKAARQAKRAANREAWRNSPLNANNLHKLTKEAAAPILPEIAEPADKGSASLAKMRAIMADPATPLYRRLDAAEVVLT